MSEMDNYRLPRPSWAQFQAAPTSLWVVVDRSCEGGTMMSHERRVTVVRRLWVSECPECGDRVERDRDPPKERRCNNCRTWVPFTLVEYEGPPLEADR